MNHRIIPVILCGGSGTRLWPASRDSRPKQFLRLVDDCTLLQNTALRAMRVSGAEPDDIIAVTLGSLSAEVQTQLADIHPAAGQHILCEPSARNTAAAVAYAAGYARGVFGDDALIWVLPSDHHIGDELEMKDAFLQAVEAAHEGRLVTFGITPTRADTGYGYIRHGAPLEKGKARSVQAFVEKPDAETAQAYVATGEYLWNSGMFLFRADTLLNEYRRHAPLIMHHALAAMNEGASPDRASAERYALIPEAPFDKAIMEKSGLVAVVPCDPAWSDIGSWESLWELREKDAFGNAVAGHAVCHGTYNCLIQTGRRLVACAGLENLVIVESGDALLIADRRQGESMRALVKAVRAAEQDGMPHMPHHMPLEQFMAQSAQTAA